MCDSRAIVTRPINLASSRKRLQLLSLYLYYNSSSYLDRPSSGAEVGRFERFVFLFLAFVCKAFCFCFLGQTYRLLLENLQVMFPFSTDTVTLV